MTRLVFCLFAAVTISACTTTTPEKSVTVSMTHSDEVTLSSMALDADQAQPQPIRCEKFLSSIALAEQKTAHMYQGYAL